MSSPQLAENMHLDQTLKRKKPPTNHNHNHHVHVLTTRTIKKPPFSYVSLSLNTSSLIPTSQLDELTVRTYISSALIQFLGITGSAISVDILKVEGREAWVRVPREDLSLFMAAVGGWVGGAGGVEGEQVGWRVLGSGNWLSSLVSRRGVEGVWEG